MRLLILLCVLSPAFAHNPLFIPGDAYFSFEITEDMIEKGLDRVQYRSLAATMYKCGSLGHQEAILTGVTPDLRRLLSAAISAASSRHREQSKSGKPEPLRLTVLIYPREFNYQERRIGLRYNENWVAWQKEKREYAVYADPGGAEAVVDNWMHGPDVPPLAFTETVKFTNADMGERDPISIDLTKTMLVVFERLAARPLADRDDDAQFSVITDRITTWTYQDHKLREVAAR